MLPFIFYEVKHNNTIPLLENNKIADISYSTWEDANASKFISISTNFILTSDKNKQGSLASL